MTDQEQQLLEKLGQEENRKAELEKALHHVQHPETPLTKEEADNLLAEYEATEKRIHELLLALGHVRN